MHTFSFIRFLLSDHLEGHHCHDFYELVRVCVMTNTSCPQDGSNFTQTRLKNTAVCCHNLKVSGERITYNIRYAVTEVKAAVLHIHSSCVAGVKF